MNNEPRENPKENLSENSALRKTEFSGPVSGPIHTGSGDINYNVTVQLTPQQEWANFDIDQLHPDKIFDTAVLRNLLKVALSSNELVDLCQDYFHPVYQEFTSEMSASKRRRLLIDFCTRHDQLRRLVHHIGKINRVRYDEYFPQLVQPVLVKFKSEETAI